jgi:putative phosphoesterase
VKIAVLADIHGNLPAFQRVLADLDDWQPNTVVVAGDVVNRGPSSKKCLELVEGKQISAGWLTVRGNHEDYVLSQARLDRPRSGPEQEIALFSLWTYRQLNGQVTSLRDMPFQVSVGSETTGEVRIVHASMRGNRQGIYPETTDAELRQRIAPPPTVLVVGHTHRPLVRWQDDTLVVNVGSVGLPFDGDDRAAYGRLTYHHGRWQAQIVRLTYDKNRAEMAFFETGFIPQAGDLARIILVELRQARSHIFSWIEQYQPAVLARKITVGDAVTAYLSGLE